MDNFDQNDPESEVKESQFTYTEYDSDEPIPSENNDFYYQYDDDYDYNYKNRLNVTGLISMILGIASVAMLVVTCCPGMGLVFFGVLLFGFEVVLSIAAIVLSIIAMNKMPDKKALAWVGFITGLLGFLGSLLALIFSLGYTGLSIYEMFA